MRIHKLIITLLVVAAAGIYILTAASIGGKSICNISIDLGKPVSVVSPFEICVVGENGENGLRIGPKIGRGWAGEAGGEASYKFYVSEEGTYYIWAYCYWTDVCSNAIFAKVDDMEKAILGNDPVYNEWHWIKGFNVYLTKGTHSVVLSNHSDNISMQKVFLTSSAIAKPDNCGVVFEDIFYDGFDGCDHGNFDSWEKVMGQWKVYDPTKGQCQTENTLDGTTEEEAMIIYRGNGWRDYFVNLSVQVLPQTPQATAAICIGVTDAENYYELRLQAVNEGRCRMQFSQVKAGQRAAVTEFETEWDQKQRHQMEIGPVNNNLSVKVDGKDVATIPMGEPITGGIGFRLEGKITAYFDNIHVRAAENKQKQ